MIVPWARLDGAGALRVAAVTGGDVVRGAVRIQVAAAAITLQAVVVQAGCTGPGRGGLGADSVVFR